MWAWQFAKMQQAAGANGWTKFISMQDQYSLIMREEEREMFPLLADQGVGCLPWSPLAGGHVARPWREGGTVRGDLATGTDFSGTPLQYDSDEAIVNAVERIANARGVSMAQVAMAWVLRNPVVTSPIVGATKVSHVTDAVSALDIRLTEEEMRELESPYVPRKQTWFA